MAHTLGAVSFNVARELTSFDDPGSVIADAKKRLLQGLTASRVWSDLIGDEVRVTLDQRPASLFREVDFDYSEDIRGKPTAYRDVGNGVDTDDPLSW
jgi:hypothetical protein